MAEPVVANRRGSGHRIDRAGPFSLLTFPSPRRGEGQSVWSGRGREAFDALSERRCEPLLLSRRESRGPSDQRPRLRESSRSRSRPGRRAGAGVMLASDIAEGVGYPPRLCREGKPELTTAPRSDTTAATGIPEGFRLAESGRVTPRGAGARSMTTARHATAAFLRFLPVIPTIFCAASHRSVATSILRPESSKSCRPSSALVP